ncbi:MAG: AMP-binding protein, partial [Syntrophales bacterium]|nr:AMP-binding protein [Syntrophales bacterium]
MENLNVMLDDTCCRWGNNTFIVHEQARMTYNEFRDAVQKLAAALSGMGVERGDKVAIMLPNCPEFVISYFAALRLGAVAVTINVLSTAYELQHLMNDCEAKVLIAQETATRKYEEIKAVLPHCRHFLPTRGMGEASAFTDIVHKGEGPVTPVTLGPEDPAAMIYTAGLTGKPLGACLLYTS